MYSYRSELKQETDNTDTRLHRLNMEHLILYKILKREVKRLARITSEEVLHGRKRANACTSVHTMQHA